MYDVTPITTAHETACGPACLKMLMDYYGHVVPLDDLIRECSVKVIGVTMKDLKRVGNAHGMDMVAFKTDADDVLKLDRPAIIHWRYTHWVVFCGLNDEGDPVICNPASGRYSIPVDYFNVYFTDYMLTNGIPEEPVEPEE